MRWTVWHMETVTISHLSELDEFLSQKSSDWLYRGQPKHYVDDHGEVSISTSFRRHGCIPPLMLTWAHYAKSMLRAFSGMDYHNIDIGISQAVLQHYGWRSFFVDLTKSVEIGCWFAANCYSENHHIQMCENFEENPVWLVPRISTYKEALEPGNLYIIDRSILTALGSTIYDLTEFDVREGRLRFEAQRACLAEGIEGRLPPESIVFHLVVDHQVLVDYYTRQGITKLQDVFPERSEDFVLRTLLDIPWEKAKTLDDMRIPVFKRSLDLPEYDNKFVKHLGMYPALFSEFWVAENRGDQSSPFHDIPFYRLPKETYFANDEDQFDLSLVSEILRDYQSFVVELDGLILIPELARECEYEKGIMVQVLEDGFIAISALTVTHPGHVVQGVGVDVGWIYKQSGAVWVRHDHPEQCPCNNELRHVLHFSILRHLNEALQHGVLYREDPLNYRHADIMYE